ncbi:F-type conjugative transfer protein TrbC, partial [Escherichia coli]
DEIMAGMAPRNPPPIMDPILARLAEITLNLDNRCDISYTPEQRGILLFEAAREAMKRSKGRWFLAQTRHRPISVSDQVAHKLATDSTAFPSPANTDKGTDPQ